MSSMFVEPQFVASAASDVENIGSVIGAAKAAAAAPTTSLVAAAEDEVSAITAAFFGSYGQQYQGLLQQAAMFHEQFVAALANAQAAYVGAETAAISLLGGGTGPVSTAVSAVTSGPATLPPGDPAFTLVMGGSGLPIPGQPYIDNVVSRYITPFFTPGTVSGLFTPEGLYPLTGIKDLTLNVSVSRGVTILDNAIQSLNTAGNTINVLGYSQSAVISSLEMSALNPTNTPGGSSLAATLNFSLIGDPMNPNGGLLERFAGLTLPSLGLTFYGATPGNSFPTHITTLEYDGYADFPQYPINLLSDVNAFLGIAFVHGTYPTLTATQLATGIMLPTSGPTTTTYTMIPTPNLPLLDLVRPIPVIGNPIADLLQPDLTVLVNIGYGSTTQGWSTGPANVPTPFGVIPPVTPGQIISALAAGTPQGVSAFMNDVNAEAPALASSVSLSSLSAATSGGASLLPAALTSAQLSPTSIIQALQTANTTVVNEITTVTSNLYATLLPTADIANALVTSFPSYDVNLFLNGVLQAINGDPTGGLIYAFGAPIAADVGLVTLAAGFETEVLLGALGLSL